MIDELRTDVTKTRKDGTRGRLRYDYGEHRDPQAALAWLWRYIDGAKTAGELYGRALVVIAAAVCLRAVWLWDRTRLVVTTEKVCVIDGTLRRRSSAVRLRSVESLELEQSFPGRMLGYGTLVAGPLEIEHVPHPRSVYRLVERLAG